MRAPRLADKTNHPNAPKGRLSSSSTLGIEDHLSLGDLNHVDRVDPPKDAVMGRKLVSYKRKEKLTLKQYSIYIEVFSFRIS